MSKRWSIQLSILAWLLAACAPAAEATPTQVAASAPASMPTPTAAAAPGPTAKPAPTLAEAPTAKPIQGGVLRMAWRRDETRLDPHLATGAWELRKPVNMTLSKLLAFPTGPGAEDCKLSPAVPNLAEKWGWQSDTEFRVTLKQGVRFHNKPPVNGRELTADDVVYSFQRYFREQDQSFNKENVLRVEAIGKDTVAFVTKGPLAKLPEVLLAMDNYGNQVVAREVVGPKLGDVKSQFQWIGTGPFVFEQWVPGVKWGFVRHAQYFKQGLPHLDGVDVLVIPDAATRLSALVSGRLDFLEFLSNPEATALKTRLPKANVRSCPLDSSIQAFMRTDLPPFNDVRVRHALSMGIDRGGIVRSVFAGAAEPIALLPSSTPGALGIQEYPAELRRLYEYNPEAARKLLAEAGFPKGMTTTLQYSTKDPTEGYVWEAMANSWAEIGVKVKLVPQSLAEWGASTQVGDYPGLGGIKASSAKDPLSWASGALLPGGAILVKAHAEDPELTALVRKYMVTTDEQESVRLLRDIQLKAAERMFSIPTPMGVYWAATQPWVKGWKITSGMNEMGDILERMWLER